MLSFEVEVVSHGKVEFSGEADSLVAPGTDGYFGILANHAPLLSALGEGYLTVHDVHGADTQFHIRGGFLEVHHNKVIVLVREMLAGVVI